MMRTFSEALEELKKDKFMKRAAVKNDTVIAIYKGKLYHRDINTGVCYPYVPTNEDLLATDWHGWIPDSEVNITVDKPYPAHTHIPFKGGHITWNSDKEPTDKEIEAFQKLWMAVLKADEENRKSKAYCKCETPMFNYPEMVWCDTCGLEVKTKER